MSYDGSDATISDAQPTDETPNAVLYPLLLEDNPQENGEIGSLQALISRLKEMHREACGENTRRNWEMGNAIKQNYKKEYGKEGMLTIAKELGVLPGFLYTVKRFAFNFNQDQLDIITNGLLALTWSDIVHNLSVPSKNFVDVYRDSKNKAEFYDGISKFKKPRKPRKTRSEKSQPESGEGQHDPIPAVNDESVNETISSLTGRYDAKQKELEVAEGRNQQLEAALDETRNQLQVEKQALEVQKQTCEELEQKIKKILSGFNDLSKDEMRKILESDKEQETPSDLVQPLQKTQKQTVYDIIAANPGIDRKTIMEQTGLTGPMVSKYLDKLKKDRKISSLKKGIYYPGAPEPKPMEEQKQSLGQASQRDREQAQEAEGNPGAGKSQELETTSDLVQPQKKTQKQAVYDAIAANPGIDRKTIMEQTRLTGPMVSKYLDKLKKDRRISSLKKGIYYPGAPEPKPMEEQKQSLGQASQRDREHAQEAEGNPGTGKSQEQENASDLGQPKKKSQKQIIYDTIEANPGIDLKTLESKTGFKNQTLRNHTCALNRENRITRNGKGVYSAKTTEQ